MFDLSKQNYLRSSIFPQLSRINSNNSSEKILSINKHLENERYKVVLGETCKACGKWTLRENMRYLLFLKEYVNVFKQEETRKKYRVFNLMKEFIRSRTANQCKSHHRKMLKIYYSPEGIIQNLSEKYASLKQEWRFFRETEPRVLMNCYPEINSSQQVYRILKFNDVIRIEIEESAIKSYLY